MGMRTLSIQSAKRFSSSQGRCRLIARGKNAEILRIITPMRAPRQIALLLCLLLPAPLAADQVRLGSHQFTLPEGFTIEPACVPDLCSRPITATLDEEGNLYASDSSGSNEKVEEQLRKRPHRILRLQDRDGDGTYEKRTVFADRMMFPEGTLWHDGSLYVSDDAGGRIWRILRGR